MEVLFVLLSVYAFAVGVVLLITFACMKKKLWPSLIVMAVAFVLFFVFIARIGVESDPGRETTETVETTGPTEQTEPTETAVSSYANQIIDLNDLSQYPWGNVLHDTLLSIGVTDIKTIECEVDSSCVTFKIVTETKKLWASIAGKYGDEWYVEWIRNYVGGLSDEPEIYYYVADCEERIYSYETGEIIYEPAPGSGWGYPLVVTVDEFVSEIRTDFDAASEKYNGKWVEITGRVTDYSRYNSSSLSGYYLYGKSGEEGIRVVCWQNKGADLQFTNVGRMCTCIGKVREVSASSTELVNCEITFE